MLPHANDDGTTVYRSGRRRALVAGSVVVAFLALFSITQEADPTTHVRPRPSEYLWQIVPFALLTLALAARALRTRLVATDNGLHVYRVTSHEFVPWQSVRAFEVHPSPTGRLTRVVARLEGDRLFRLGVFLVRRRDGGRSPGADRLAAALRGEMEERLVADGLRPAA
jgi:hypothetical protein